MARKKRDTTDMLKKLQDKMGTVDTGDSGFWRPDQGRNVIRILPPVGNMEYFFQEVGKHYNLPDGQIETCPAFTTNGEESCPICELSRELYRGSDSDKKLAGKLRVRKQFWMNVIVREPDDDDGNTGKGPLMYTPGVGIFRSLQTLVGDPDYGDITHPEDGIDLVIDRTGDGKETTYEVQARRYDTPLHTDPEQVDAWLDEAMDISVAILSLDPEEDQELGQGYAIRILPYDRILDKYDLGPEEDGEPEPAKEADPDVGEAIKARRQRRR